MTTNIVTETVLITGPTSGLGRALALELAGRAESDRPDLLLVGRPGERLTEITSLVRADGATAEAIPCDLSRLADVRAAGTPLDTGPLLRDERTREDGLDRTCPDQELAAIGGRDTSGQGPD